MNRWIVMLLIPAAIALCSCSGGGGGGSTPSGPVSGSPVIAIPPASQTANVGDTVEFSVSATGTAPLSYQWHRNGQTIPGATAALYSIAQASGVNANDRFSVTVSNDVNPTGVTSADATLSMRPVVGIDLIAGAIPAINPPGGIDGVGPQALFGVPRKIAADGSGNIYVADLAYGLRRITPEGRVSTLPADTWSWRNGADVIAADAAGNIYTNHFFSVVKISPDGLVTTLAGRADGSGGGAGGDTDGIGSAASFNSISGIAVDAAGNVYVSETSNVVRKITPSGAVTTLAGAPGVAGSADGTGAAARFFGPRGLTVDPSGNLFVVDAGNMTIRKVTPEGVVTTLAGTVGVWGNVNGNGTSARFIAPEDIVGDPDGNLYVAEADGVRKVTPAATVTTLAGKALVRGYADGVGTAALFSYPRGITIDARGNLYVADEGNGVIRKVTPAGAVTTFAGRVPQGIFDTCTGSADGSGFEARFNRPHALAADAAGNVYIADAGNHTVRKMSPTGVVTTLAGSPGIAGNGDGIGANARFSQPQGITIDVTGSVFVADTGNRAIRKITPTGMVTTLPGAQGLLSSSLTSDTAGNVYAQDLLNASIRKIAPDGTVSTLASGLVLSVGDPMPGGVAADSEGNIYVVHQDYSSFAGPNLYYVVGKVTPEGAYSRLAGDSQFPTQFRDPQGIAVDKAGNVYVADAGNYSILRITPSGTVTTIAGRPDIASGSSVYPGTVGTKLGRFPGSLTFPSGLAVTGNGANARLLVIDMDALLSVTLSP